jgi:hypothetical protein
LQALEFFDESNTLDYSHHAPAAGDQGLTFPGAMVLAAICPLAPR